MIRHVFLPISFFYVSVSIHALYLLLPWSHFCILERFDISIFTSSLIIFICNYFECQYLEIRKAIIKTFDLQCISFINIVKSLPPTEFVTFMKKMTDKNDLRELFCCVALHGSVIPLFYYSVQESPDPCLLLLQIACLLNLAYDLFCLRWRKVILGWERHKASIWGCI